MMFRKTMTVRTVTVAALVLFILGISNLLLAADKKPWELIQWDKPKPAAERLSADEYILPEGWKEATKGVKRILHFNAGGMEHDPGTLANFKLFESLTGIKADFVEVSDQVLLQKTISVLVSRDPNVTSVCVSEPAFAMQHLISAGWLEPMDAIWSAGVQKIYPAGLLNLLKGPDGHFYGTVDTQKAGLTYMRPSWLKAAGVEQLPTTWQDIIAAAKKARAWAEKNLDQTYWGIGYGCDHYFLQTLQAMTYAQGGRMIKDGKIFLLTPEFTNTWNTYVNFVKDGIAPQAVLGWTWNDYQQAFAMGKIAIISGSLNTNIVRFADGEKSPGLTKTVDGKSPAESWGDWIVAPAPKWSQDVPDSYIGSAPINLSAFAINKFAPDNAKAAAMILGEVRMSKQGGINELLIEGNSPFLPSTFDDPKIIEKVGFVDVRKTANQNAILEVFPPGGEKAIDIILEYYGKAATGKMDAMEALNKAQAEIDAFQTY